MARSTRVPRVRQDTRAMVAQLNAARDRHNGQQKLKMAERQTFVADLWIRGSSIQQIMAALHVTEQTVHRDLKVIRQQLQVERLPDMQSAINYSRASYRAVINEAWTLYYHLRDHGGDRSNQTVGALNTVLLAQQRIDELEGLTAPDRLNAAALAEVYGALMEALDGLPPEVKRRFLATLAKRTHGAPSPLLVGREAAVVAAMGGLEEMGEGGTVVVEANGVE